VVSRWLIQYRLIAQLYVLKTQIQRHLFHILTEYNPSKLEVQKNMCMKKDSYCVLSWPPVSFSTSESASIFLDVFFSGQNLACTIFKSIFFFSRDIFFYAPQNNTYYWVLIAVYLSWDLWETHYSSLFQNNTPPFPMSLDLYGLLWVFLMDSANRVHIYLLAPKRTPNSSLASVYFYTKSSWGIPFQDKFSW